MTDPAVTIAIPVFNAETTVGRSLLSALDQDFALPYEVLVIDDCGTDRSMEIVQQTADHHPRCNTVRTVRHPENRGLGAARNTAIDEARGKYLFFLDADDWMLPEALSHLYELAEREQADVTAGSTDCCQQGQTSPHYQLVQQVVRHEAAGVWMVVHDVFMNIEVWNKLLRLDFLRRNHIRTVHRIMEDSIFDFHLRIQARTIVLSPQVTLCYNLHPESILGSLFGHQATDEAVSIYCDIVRQAEILIRERYHDVPGIYDLYALRLFYTFHSLRKMQLTDAQELYIRTTLPHFLGIIPSMRSLCGGAFRMAYLVCKLRGGDWRAFERAYDSRYTRFAYYLKRFLLLF